MKHALLSPSAADKWTNCPGMPKLAAKVDYKVGVPAAVGTLIHSMTEQLLKGFLVDVSLEDYWLGKKELVEDFEIEVDQDMIDCAKVYVDYVQNRTKEIDGRLLVEQKVRLEEISDNLYGYADALIITPKTLFFTQENVGTGIFFLTHRQNEIKCLTPDSHSTFFQILKLYLRSVCVYLFNSFNFRDFRGHGRIFDLYFLLQARSLRMI